jgi:hypothetical protein
MGAGVYALRPYKADETVEVCVVEVVEMPFKSLAQEWQDRVFNWGYLTKGNGQAVPNLHALAGGFGGMYNDNNFSNMRYEALPGAN